MDKSASKFQMYLFRITSTVTFTLFAFWSYFSMIEWYTVAIQKKTINYVFNGMPWYYESAKLYARVMLIEGVVLLALLGLITFFIVKKRNAVYLMLVAGLIYSIVTIVYGQAV